MQSYLVKDNLVHGIERYREKMQQSLIANLRIYSKAAGIELSL